MGCSVAVLGDEGKRGLIGGIPLCDGQDVVGDQLVEDLTLALLCEREVLNGVVLRRRLRKSREHGRLGPGELVGGNAEITTSGTHIAPVAVPVVDGVEVHLEHHRS